MKYLQRRKKDKLYRQWVERAGLPLEAVPPNIDDIDNLGMGKDDTSETSSPKIFGYNLLYILLAVAILILCTGLILLLIYSF
ncbi:MAG: hypothetical protein PHQ86_03040 [Dehalococcoidales bacterium]|nr:hypothetical protein [Dehalococcoidales bacterium]